MATQLVTALYQSHSVFDEFFQLRYLLFIKTIVIKTIGEITDNGKLWY